MNDIVRGFAPWVIGKAREQVRVPYLEISRNRKNYNKIPS